MLSDVFHLAGHNTFPFYSRSRPSPRWLETLGNFVFWPSWRSSERSFPICWIPLDNYTGKTLVCDASDSVGLLPSGLCDHVLHFVLLPNYLDSDLLTQWYSQHGTFHSPLCHNQSLFFLLCSNLCFPCIWKQRQNGTIEETDMLVFVQLCLKHIFYHGKCFSSRYYSPRDFFIHVLAQYSPSIVSKRTLSLLRFHRSPSLYSPEDVQPGNTQTHTHTHTHTHIYIYIYIYIYPWNYVWSCSHLLMKALLFFSSNMCI